MLIETLATCLINFSLALNLSNKPSILIPNQCHNRFQSVWVVGQAVPVASKGNFKSWDQFLQEWVTSDGFGNNVSLGVSVFALIVSWFGWRSSADQLAREKREELRQILENLLDLREEWIQKSRQINDELEKNRIDIAINQKKGLFLQAAETLAKQIQQFVSSTEFITLAEENIYTGDYVQARLFFQNAVTASKHSSKFEEATALRYLAGNYFQQEPKQFEKGRECFQRAIDCTRSESDPYWIYAQIIAYGGWAQEEMNNGFLDKAKELLQVIGCSDDENLSKLDLLAKVAPGYTLEETQRKYISGYWQQLGAKYYDSSLPQKGLNAMQNALKMIEKYDDSNQYSTNNRGWIYYIWGEKELKNNPVQANEHLLKALDHFSKLREDFPWRSGNLQQVENLLKSSSLTLLSEDPISGSSQI